MHPSSDGANTGAPRAAWDGPSPRLGRGLTSARRLGGAAPRRARRPGLEEHLSEGRSALGPTREGRHDVLRDVLGERDGRRGGVPAQVHLRVGALVRLVRRLFKEAEDRCVRRGGVDPIDRHRARARRRSRGRAEAEADSRARHVDHPLQQTYER